MAGHSHSKNIAHQKGKSDAKKAKIFNKLGREITVSAKLGSPDPASNPRLRAAMAEARASNMPRDRIEKALKAAQPGGGDPATYDDVRYEGFGPGGIALIVEGLTDNRNRTASEVRTIFAKHGGAMGESNSVAFMFSRVGLVVYPASVVSADAMLEAVIEAGGENVDSGEEAHEVTTSVEDFGAVRAALEKKFGEALIAKLVWKPQNLIPATGPAAEELLKLIEALEDNDDVQAVTCNADISSTQERLAG